MKHIQSSMPWVDDWLDSYGLLVHPIFLAYLIVIYPNIRDKEACNLMHP
jgi:hypothetical protein